MKVALVKIFMGCSLLTAVMSGLANGDFTYQGFGGWRTFDAQGYPLADASGDKGYARQGGSVAYCQQLCRDDQQCKGIEWVDNGGGNTTCEIHYDSYAYCDSRGGSKTSLGQDGCWMMPSRKQAESEPTDTFGRDAKQECFSKHWDWISFNLPNKADYLWIDRMAANTLKLSPSTESYVFGVDTNEQDCTIRLRHLWDDKYWSINKGNYYITASTSLVGAPDIGWKPPESYKVYQNTDGTYSLKAVFADKWITKDPNGNALLGNWDAMFSKYTVFVHNPK